MKNLLLAALSALLLCSCSDNKAEHVERAFYYWKNNEHSFSAKEDTIISTTCVEKVYLKFFEVEKHSLMGIIPTAKTDYYTYTNPHDLTIVPVAYIRNEVFKGASKSELDTLAGNVHFLISKYGEEKFRDGQKFPELQIDCDWTLSTRDNYFYFLKKLKQVSGKELSCTLRLYPYKYPGKMGVPPVDKTMLMCYNLVNPLKNPGKNSILDKNELEAYLDTGKKYPLHLDIALPVYSWIQVYQNDHFEQVLYTDTKEALGYLKQEKPLWYEVTKDTVVNDFYLRAGDKVKIEEVTTLQIDEVIRLLKKHVDFDENITVSLFHLDENQLKKYNNEDLVRFYTAFTE